MSRDEKRWFQNNAST